MQSNNYYPFGLQQNTSWTRAAQTPNAHKFNAATEYNDFTDTYDTPFRQYDPATGRFNGVDALAHMTPTLTPYRFGFNNPVSFNDPTGLTERPVELDDPNLRAAGGQASILSGADNDFSMIWFSGSMGPGSGRYWSDGIHYSDWTPNGGSQMYRDGIAAGLYDLGGRLYGFNKDGELEAAKEKDGRLGFYEDRGDGYWRDREIEVNGGAIQLKEFVRQATFVALDDMPEEEWELDWQRGWNQILKIAGLRDWDPNNVGDAAVINTQSAVVPDLPIGPGGAAKGAKEVYTLYKAVAKNGKTYWGITKNFLARARQHGARFPKGLQEVYTGLSRSAARGLEQLKIDQYGLKNLDNAINSISKSNPKLAEYYREAIRYMNGL